MTKKLLIALMCLFAVKASYAEYLTSGQAFERFCQTAKDSRKAAALRAANPTLQVAFSPAQGNPAVYVFKTDAGSSVIISGSDLTEPLLGYTDNPIDPNNIAPAMQYWMNEYASQIAYLESRPEACARRVFPADWKFIAPMVKTKWSQMSPYNSELENTNYATGCVATAMAQIMKYWNYPEKGHGEHSYTYTDAFGQSVTNSIDFGAREFDWSEMLDTYTEGSYTEAEASAVAYLMKACGYSTDTFYSGSSATQTERAAIALPQFFGYDSSIQYLQRFQYESEEWNEMLYTQLSTVGPVLYTGLSLQGIAHAFVADGYDGNGYFHINWGWSGLSDGYFLLDALNPPVQSTGGSTSGYNFSQGMILNIMKPQGEPSYTPEAYLTLLGNMSGTNIGNELTLTMSQANPGSILNNSTVAVTPEFAICIESETANMLPVYNEVSSVLVGGEYDIVPEMGPGSYLSETFGVEAPFDVELPDGKYKVSVVWKDQGTAYDGNDPWQRFITAPGCHDYVYVVKNGTTYTIENLPLYRFTIESARTVTPLYFRNPCEIEFTFTNTSEYELTQSVIPLLYYPTDGGERTLAFMGDTQLVTVGPGETLTKTLAYTFEQKSSTNLPTASSPKEYVIGAFDYGVLLEKYYMMGEFGDSYYGDLGTATMYRATGSPRLEQVRLAVDKAEEMIGENEGIIFGIDNPSAIEATLSLVNTGAFLATPLSAYIYDGETVVSQKNFGSLLVAPTDAPTSASVTLGIEDFDPATLYTLSVSYLYQGQLIELAGVGIAASTGVDAVLAGAETSRITVFDLNGTIVYSGKEPAVTLSLPKGIYIVRTEDSAGNVKNSKILR